MMHESHRAAREVRATVVRAWLGPALGVWTPIPKHPTYARVQINLPPKPDLPRLRILVHVGPNLGFRGGGSRKEPQTEWRGNRLYGLSALLLLLVDYSRA